MVPVSLASIAVIQRGRQRGKASTRTPLDLMSELLHVGRAMCTGISQRILADQCNIHLCHPELLLQLQRPRHLCRLTTHRSMPDLLRTQQDQIVQMRHSLKALAIALRTRLSLERGQISLARKCGVLTVFVTALGLDQKTRRTGTEPEARVRIAHRTPSRPDLLAESHS